MKRFTLYLGEMLSAKLQKVSSKKNISQNAIIKLALSEWLERNDSE